MLQTLSMTFRTHSTYGVIKSSVKKNLVNRKAIQLRKYPGCYKVTKKPNPARTQRGIRPFEDFEDYLINPEKVVMNLSTDSITPFNK